ncbi:MAG: hypothetical protein QXH91_07035 [Candidatus Bathyarchaeia archaeon]
MSDVELEYIKLKKLKELKSKYKPTTSQTENRDPFAIVRKKLVGRGEEVLNAAYSQYPQVTKKVIDGIAKLIEDSKNNEPITGEILYEIFYSLGYPIRLETKIVFKNHGEVKTLTEKLKENI